MAFLKERLQGRQKKEEQPRDGETALISRYSAGDIHTQLVTYPMRG
jgi:hypothetical protein